MGRNRSFKSICRQEYHNWRKVHNATTKDGNLKKPGRQDFINMVSVAWAKVDDDCIRKAFVGVHVIPESYAEQQCSAHEESFYDLSLYNEHSFWELETDQEENDAL